MGGDSEVAKPYPLSTGRNPHPWRDSLVWPTDCITVLRFANPPPAQPHPSELDFPTLARHVSELTHPLCALTAQQHDHRPAGQSHTHADAQGVDHSSRSRPLAANSAAVRNPSMNDTQHATNTMGQLITTAPVDVRRRWGTHSRQRASPGTWLRTGTAGRPCTGRCGRHEAAGPCWPCASRR